MAAAIGGERPAPDQLGRTGKREERERERERRQGIEYGNENEHEYGKIGGTRGPLSSPVLVRRKRKDRLTIAGDENGKREERGQGIECEYDKK